jgi:hypothetical protein
VSTGNKCRNSSIGDDENLELAAIRMGRRMLIHVKGNASEYLILEAAVTAILRRGLAAARSPWRRT